MSKGNKQAKKRLIRIYGQTDMFVAANVEHALEAIGITGYKIFEEQKRYRGKPITQQLTFHHLRHRSEGGDHSIDNGALVGQTHHEYMHSLPRDQEEIVNSLIRQWKVNFLTMNGKGEVLDSGSFSPDFSDCITIPVYDTTPEQRKKAVQSKKYKEYKNPSRAQKKRELQRLIDEEFEK